MFNSEEIRESINQDEIRFLSDNQLKTYIQNKIIDYIIDYNDEVDIDYVTELTKDIFYEIRGLGIIERLLEDNQINEIMINAYDEIYLEKDGEMYKSIYKFKDNSEYERIIQKIVSEVGREVNTSKPIVDARIYDGSRVNIVLNPISKDNPAVTIRKFSNENYTIDDLMNMGLFDKEVYDFLEVIIKSKYNIMIGGGTSSGKTTLLGALTNFINKSERIITIEDSRELKIDLQNLISLQSREANVSHGGNITMKDLIKNSLRMRPDRIIVGEVRADETLDMLQSMNTGHQGSLSTVHANSSRDMISRLETMVLRAGDDIPLEAVKRLINSSIEIIIYLKKIKNTRKITEIVEIIQDKNGDTVLNPIYEYNASSNALVKVGEIINKYKLEENFE
ncbi:CpaF family protein [Helcococcus sueciensis]|uniref:CpaF family protein n=1 Tax=Helcococcus sueciensis TaxID=241555 RepID=UPI00041CCE5E|nr:CpaF family protein [Helcococcus sueciensis]